MSLRHEDRMTATKLESFKEKLLQLCKEEGVHLEVREPCAESPHSAGILLKDDDNCIGELDVGEVFPES